MATSWERQQIIASRLAFWSFLLAAALLLAPTDRLRVGVLGSWALMVTVGGLLWWAGTIDPAQPRWRVLRLSATAEMLGIGLLVALTGGLESPLTVAFIPPAFAVTRLLPQASGTSVALLGLLEVVALGIAALVAGRELESDVLARTFVLLAVLFGTAVFGRWLGIETENTERALADEADLSRSRGTAVQRGAVLLDATNRFVASRTAGQLDRAVLEASMKLLEADKVAISLFRPPGDFAVVAAANFTGAELRRLEETPDELSLIRRRVVSGEESWSDDDATGEVVRRLESYGANAGVILPVVGRHGVEAVLTAMYREARTFDESFREYARSLAAQAALAYELVRAREKLERGREELAEQIRRTDAFLRVSQDLSALTDRADVQAALARAVCQATGARFAVVGRWHADTEELEFVATEGLDWPELEVLTSIPPTIDRYGMFRPVLAGDVVVRREPFSPGDFPPDLARALRAGAIAAAPLFLGTEVWGFLGVAASKADADLHTLAPEVVAGLASIGATAIARAEAVDELERQAEQLESAVADRTVQLRLAVDELRVASEAKSEFLANVSHELRTPLTAILGFSDVLVKGLDGPLSPEQFEDVRTINGSSRHLLDLIDDLIDISRIEAGRIELRREPIDIGGLLRTAVDEVGPLAAEKAIELSLEADGLPPSIEADRARIREILLNLLSNAVKFTPAGGSVRVEARGDDGGGIVRIDVVDTGMGIAPGDQDLIFEKFYRVAGPEHGGTGLGLSIAREFARLHGGDLVVASGLGRGSRFSLTLPVRRDDDERGRPVERSAGAPEGSRDVALRTTGPVEGGQPVEAGQQAEQQADGAAAFRQSSGADAMAER